MLNDPQAQSGAADLLQPVRAYEGPELEKLLAALEAECVRLRSSIYAVEARRDELLAAQPPSVTEHLGSVMLEAQAQITEEWETCHGTAAAIEDATDAAVERILAEARAHAASLRTIAEELRSPRSGATDDDGEQWWQERVYGGRVIDLTRHDAPEPARTG